MWSIGLAMEDAYKKTLTTGKGNKTLMDFVCRGNDGFLKRKRWLNLYGVEKQYMESIRNEGTSSKAWWVFHSMKVSDAGKCHRYPAVPIYSGLYWDYLTVYPNKVYTFGIEWTPAGYKAFINGKPYGGHAHTSGASFKEYGYGLSRYTGVYGWSQYRYTK